MGLSLAMRSKMFAPAPTPIPVHRRIFIISSASLIRVAMVSRDGKVCRRKGPETHAPLTHDAEPTNHRTRPPDTNAAHIHARHARAYNYYQGLDTYMQCGISFGLARNSNMNHASGTEPLGTNLKQRVEACPVVVACAAHATPDTYIEQHTHESPLGACIKRDRHAVPTSCTVTIVDSIVSSPSMVTVSGPCSVSRARVSMLLCTVLLFVCCASTPRAVVTLSLWLTAAPPAAPAAAGSAEVASDAVPWWFGREKSDADAR